MKKEDVLGTFMYLLMLGLAVVYIMTILGPRASSSGIGDLYFLFNLGSLVAGIVFNALLFEVGHVIGAKIGGYKVTYVSVLGLTLKKENEKWKFCLSGFHGLTGETRIAPNREDASKCSPYPYLLFGSLFYAIELIAVLVVFFIYKDEFGTLGNVAYFLLNICAVGSIIFFYNIIPAQLDCVTDGYNLALFANPKNREAYNELIKVNYELSQGKNAEIKVFDEITNFTSSINMKKVHLLLSQGKYNEAEIILDKILVERKSVSYDVYLKAKSEKIFINFMTLSPEEVMKFYENEVPIAERRDIANNKSTSSVRAYLLMSGIGDKSRSECIVCLNKITKSMKKVPEKIKDIEIDLFNLSLRKICELHEKWELDKYIINK